MKMNQFTKVCLLLAFLVLLAYVSSQPAMQHLFMERLVMAQHALSALLATASSHVTRPSPTPTPFVGKGRVR